MFTHLHVHSEYSLLDGMCRISHLFNKAKEMGMNSLTVTDHGVLYGIITFYREAKEAGIKPIIGCELYVAPKEKESKLTAEKNPYHLIVLAKNDTGYHNLLRLVTTAHLEGFYYKPRVDKELLAQYHEGLVALSSCPQGEIGRLILEGRPQDAEKAALWYKEVFGDFYLELQRHDNIPELEQINKGLVGLSRKLNLPLVATNDVHYVNKDDAYAHDVLLCIQTNNTIHNEKRPRMSDDSFYLKSPQEMAELFADVPDAIANTERVAELCNLNLEFGRLHLPEIELPPGVTADELLAQLSETGLQGRYPGLPPEAVNRLKYELDVIRKTQFANYFLVIWDVISFVRDRNILFGVRGSAAASIVLYCLGITDIDPLEHRLVFERFLNIERKEMPDIDLDFQDDRRDEVIKYVAQRYGQDHVAQIITFGTLGVRAAIRDVGRALGMSYGSVDQVARQIPGGPAITIQEALETNAELHNSYRNDAAIKHLIDTAIKLEGVARHASTHAAGVVISRESLIKHVPLQRPSRGDEQSINMTQFAMDDIAKIGLLKMDFLGLANLTILEKAKQTISRTRGIDLDLHRLPLDDNKTFELLSAGETTGVFQLEGAAMRRFIKELKPTCFGDIAAMVALYRPGPKQHIPTFIRAKHGIEPIRFPHQALAQILQETYGVIVYQDQVLLIVQAFAGYSLGEADIVRKAMGKKVPEIMKKEMQRFLSGAKKKGFSKEVAEQVWNLIEPFAGYAFNKAHSVSYAMIAYQTAYLKANYSVEFMCALLTANMGQAEKIANAVAECQRLGIKVLPPDVSRSGETFAIESEGDVPGIRFGLAAIKNVGAAAIRPIIAAREQGGPFKSIEDFCRRADLRNLNKRALESIIKAGAMDSLGNRGALLAGVDRILSLAQTEQRLKEKGQSTMFDLWGQSVDVPLPGLELPGMEASPKEKLLWEKELLGVCLSDHPFSYASQKLAAKVDVFCGQINDEMVGQTVMTAGTVTSTRQIFTKDRRQFVSAVLEDFGGSVEVTVWPEVYERTKTLWEEGNMLLVKGKVKARGEGVQLVCLSASQYQPTGTEEAADTANGLNEVPLQRRLRIRISTSTDSGSDITLLRRIVDILKQFPGTDEVYLAIVSGEEITKLTLPDSATSYCPELHRQLAELVGEQDLTVENKTA
ncbi:MAG: DNA polymerase III subunit alpha [Chloroflexi bacterium]|nr:DNA polymerase III subunit alpha [Chloroflexota bacterium]